MSKSHYPQFLHAPWKNGWRESFGSVWFRKWCQTAAAIPVPCFQRHTAISQLVMSLLICRGLPTRSWWLLYGAVEKCLHIKQAPCLHEIWTQPPPRICNSRSVKGVCVFLPLMCVFAVWGRSPPVTQPCQAPSPISAGGNQLFWQKTGVTLKSVRLSSIVCLWFNWLNIDPASAVEGAIKKITAAHGGNLG